MHYEEIHQILLRLDNQIKGGRWVGHEARIGGRRHGGKSRGGGGGKTVFRRVVVQGEE